jgi:hypothetical protein
MSDTPGLPLAAYRRFEGMREYESLLDGLIPQTQRYIRIFDKRLSRSYNSPERQELVRQFLLGNPLNRLMIVVHEAAPLDLECPRLVHLLQQFGHAIKIRQTQRAASHLYDPFVVFDASHYLHRFHYDHLRAAVGTHDVNGANELLDRFGEIWEASTPAAVAGATGL